MNMKLRRYFAFSRKIYYENFIEKTFLEKYILQILVIIFCMFNFTIQIASV